MSEDHGNSATIFPPFCALLWHRRWWGGGGGIKSRWDCYVEVLECILAWWCLGKDAVRSLHKQFSNSVLVEPKVLTRQTLGPPLDTTRSQLNSTSVPNRNFSLQYSFSYSRSHLVLDQPSTTYSNILLVHNVIPTAAVIVCIAPRDCREPKAILSSPVRGTRNT